MARTGRQTRSFNVIRRGPLLADEFHYSLDAWQLSKEAMLETKHKKQGDFSRKAGKVSIAGENKNEFESPKNDLRLEISLPKEGEMINDAMKQLCRDVIVVAAHGVSVADGRATRNIELATEDKKDPLQHQERGDGDAKFQDLPMKVEPPCNGQNLEIGSFANSVEMLQERARVICKDVITKAVYQVSKENLDNVQNTLKSAVTKTLQTNVKANSNETLETMTRTQDQQKQKHNEEEKKMPKKLEKAKKKEEKELRKYQEETAKKYIKMVSKKYKERNEINAKSSKKEMKEQQKALKREKKERKREERNLKKEKNKMANKGNHCAALFAGEITDKEENTTGKAPQDNGKPKLAFIGRIGQLFGCTKESLTKV